MDTTDKFRELFRGRTDAYGTEQGGCDRVDPPTDLDPYWHGYESEHYRRIKSHLYGANPMGIYPLRDDLTVLWGCTDLDNGDADLPNAINLAAVLEAMGVNAHVERSRSKGYHVWTFATQAVPAETMRNTLLAAHQTLQVPATEVNPKQTSLEGLKGFGNYVRLPYPGGAMDPNMIDSNHHRQMIDRHTLEPIPLDEFVDEAWWSRSTPDAYQEAADKFYVPPPPPKPVEILQETQLDSSITSRLSRDGYLAWKYGPKEGNDRSNSLMRLAYLSAESGLRPEETLAVIRDLDRRLGKFVHRTDGEEQLLRMVTRAHER